jgi:dTDP-4-amino-4,6-dideoxygalactose transaminase
MVLGYKQFSSFYRNRAPQRGGENEKGDGVVREIPFGRPLIGDEERKAVEEVLHGPILVHGPRAREFERAFSEFTGAPFSVSVSSCTAALHLFYFCMGIGPGDEVIVPAQTHTATAHAVELTGAKPVFVDAEIATGNIDIGLIERAVTDRTRAISVVHYLGMPVDMDRVNSIAEKHSLLVLEDCALAVGTRYKEKHAGLLGDAGCFSFYPVKHLTTAEGGMLITANPDIAAKAARQKAFGVDRPHGDRALPGVYDVTMLGFNYRLSEVHAAIGIAQMKRAGDILSRREENYRVLAGQLAGIGEISLFQSTHDSFRSSYYCLSVLLDEKTAPQRTGIIRFMNENGVGTSVYYPRPVPHFTYYREKYGYRDDGFPVAARISASSIALPVGPHLNGDDMKRIAEILKEAIRRNRG